MHEIAGRLLFRRVAHFHFRSLFWPAVDDFRISARLEMAVFLWGRRRFTITNNELLTAPGTVCGESGSRWNFAFAVNFPAWSI